MANVSSNVLITRDGMSKVAETSTTSSTPSNPPNIQTIPYEILVLILNSCSPVTITILGLTSTTLFALTQPLLPNPKPPLTLCSCGTDSHRISHLGHPRLADLIADWIGPSYRYHRWSGLSPYLTRPSFFKKSIYDDPVAFQAVMDRWADRIESFDECYVLGVATGAYDYRLPSPFGVGDGWYKLAREAMMDDFERNAGLKNWLWYWNRFHVSRYGEGYEEIVDEFLWEVWGNGVKLLNL